MSQMRILLDVEIEAAAKALYEERPEDTDPVHWETPWEDVPEGWKRGQRRAAKRVLMAAERAAHEARSVSDNLLCWDCGQPSTAALCRKCADLAARMYPGGTAARVGMLFEKRKKEARN